jgi:hypothetical protein
LVVQFNFYAQLFFPFDPFSFHYLNLQSGKAIYLFFFLSGNGHLLQVALLAALKKKIIK